MGVLVWRWFIAWKVIDFTAHNAEKVSGVWSRCPSLCLLWSRQNKKIALCPFPPSARCVAWRGHMVPWPCHLRQPSLPDRWWRAWLLGRSSKAIRRLWRIHRVSLLCSLSFVVVNNLWMQHCDTYGIVQPWPKPDRSRYSSICMGLPVLLLATARQKRREKKKKRKQVYYFCQHPNEKHPCYSIQNSFLFKYSTCSGSMQTCVWGTGTVEIPDFLSRR